MSIFNQNENAQNKTFFQSSDLATLGRRTSAMETLVTQLREAAETSVVPQEEEKGEKVPIIMRIENPHIRVIIIGQEPALWKLSSAATIIMINQIIVKPVFGEQIAES